MQSNDAKLAVAKCKDGCCPRLKPYPTWASIIGAVGMAVMVAALLLMFVGIISRIGAASPLWFGALCIPIALGIFGIVRKNRASRKSDTE